MGAALRHTSPVILNVLQDPCAMVYTTGTVCGSTYFAWILKHVQDDDLFSTGARP
jgi:hypothetical protein